jgi:hypothetical protein
VEAAAVEAEEVVEVVEAVVEAVGAEEVAVAC